MRGKMQHRKYTLHATTCTSRYRLFYTRMFESTEKHILRSSTHACAVP